MSGSIPDDDDDESVLDLDFDPIDLFEASQIVSKARAEPISIEPASTPVSKPMKASSQRPVPAPFVKPASKPPVSLGAAPVVDKKGMGAGGAGQVVPGAEDFQCLRCLKTGSPVQRPREVGGLGIFCANCDKEIPDDYWQHWKRIPTLKFSLVGLRGNGKTCFLQGLVKRLDEGLGDLWSDFRHLPVSVEDDDMLNRWRKKFDKGNLPAPNQIEDGTDTAALYLKGVPGVGEMFLLLFDISGEAFRQKRYLQSKAEFVQRSQVVTCLVSLSDDHNGSDFTSMLRLLQEGLGEVGVKTKEISLVLALTKGDLHLTDESLPESARGALTSESPCDPFDAARLKSISHDLERWVIQHPQNFRNFALNVRDVFADVQYTIFSGTGFKPVGVQVEYEPRPRNVVDPLLLLMQNSLPRVTVTGPAGSETYFSLDEAIAAAANIPGQAVVELSAGRFRLDTTLTLKTAVRLVGQGCEKTIIYGACSGMLVCLQSPLAEVERISFIRQGTEPACVALVRGGRFRFTACRFTGGVQHAVTKRYGHGVEVVGTSTGRVVNCESSSNAGSGFRVAGTAHVTLEGNRSHDNQIGIALSNNCQAVVQAKNVCFRNEHGIGIFEQASVQIRDNLCHNNRVFGIVDNGNGRGNGVIEQNVCSNATGDGESGGIQQQVGIGIQGAAHPSLSKNVCNHNAKDGIQVKRSARPVLNGNTASRNGRNGIGVFDISSPSIINSICSENVVGISVDKKVPRGAKIKQKSNQCGQNSQADFIDRRPGLFG